MDEDKVRKGIREYIEFLEKELEKFAESQNAILGRLGKEAPVEPEEIPQAMEIVKEELARSGLPKYLTDNLVMMLEGIFGKKVTYIV